MEDRLRVLITREEIGRRVNQLAGELRGHYPGSYPLLIGILKGSFIFLADLARALDIPLEVDFVRLASYGAGTRSTGRIRMELEPSAALQGRHVLVVEDIVDTGHSLRFLLSYLEQRGPASLRVCALLDKPSRREVQVPLDYVGFTVPNLFLVGYGLDYAERYRHLPDVCALERA